MHPWSCSRGRASQSFLKNKETLFPKAHSRLLLALPWPKRALACLPLNSYWWDDFDHLALGVPENGCCRYPVGLRSPTGLSRCSESLSGGLLPPSQAAYLVGISDPNSQAGHQGLVDPIQFARANQAIQMACQNLVDPGSSPSQVTLGGGRCGGVECKVCASLSSWRWVVGD